MSGILEKARKAMSRNNSGIVVAGHKKAPSISNEDDSCRLAGALHKLGAKQRSLKLRYFKLYRDVLRYFKDDPAPEPAGSFGLHRAVVATESDPPRTQPDCTFGIVIPLADGDTRKFILTADTPTLRDKWVAGLTVQQKALRHAKAAEPCNEALRGDSVTVRAPSASTTEDHVDSVVVYQGWLVKKKRRRFFVLTMPSGIMKYYRAKPQENPKGEIKLRLAKIQKEDGRDFSFKQEHKGGGFFFSVTPTVHDTMRKYVLIADSEEERSNWMKAIHRAVDDANDHMHHGGTKESLATVAEGEDDDKLAMNTLKAVRNRVGSGMHKTFAASMKEKREGKILDGGTASAPTSGLFPMTNRIPGGKGARAFSELAPRPVTGRPRRASGTVTVSKWNDLRKLPGAMAMPVPKKMQAEASSCSHCVTKFAGFATKHNCRMCGKMYCGRCTALFSIPTKFHTAAKDKNAPAKFAPARVCFGCETRVRQGLKWTTKMLNKKKIAPPEWDFVANYIGCRLCTRTKGRSHNCRACGRLFCSNCTSKVPVPPQYKLKGKPGPARVCDRCRFQMEGGALLTTNNKYVTLSRAAGAGAALSRSRGYTVAEEQKVMQRAPAALVMKIKAAVCDECNLPFSVFLRQHRCFHCPTAWCQKCLDAHQLSLAKDKRFRESMAAARKKQLAQDRVRAASMGLLAAKRVAVKVKRKAQAAVEAKKALDPINKYEILARLGEGTYGAVFKAREKEGGRFVAIKLLERGSEKNDPESLKKEIDFMSDLKSDHLVQFEESFEHGNKVAIVMEYCEAGSLNDIMEICDITIAESIIAVIMRESLLGLNFLHAAGRIHRDVKAGNILVNAEGECKLADFGIATYVTPRSKADKKKVAKVKDSKGRKKHPDRRHTMIGTPYWMAPEVLQATKDGPGYDMSCDIWSLGITALEIAKGMPPHSEMHPMRAIFKIPISPSPVLPDPENWSEEFVDFLRVTLEKDPSKRATAEELLSRHPFITGAGTIAELKHMTKASLEEIEAFRKKEVEVAKQLEMRKLRASAAPSAQSTRSKPLDDDEFFDFSDTLMYPSGTMVFDMDSDFLDGVDLLDGTLADDAIAAGGGGTAAAVDSFSSGTGAVVDSGFDSGTMVFVGATATMSAADLTAQAKGNARLPPREKDLRR